MPIAVVDRVGPSLYARALAGQALALRLRGCRESGGQRAAGRKPPAWVFLHGLKIAATPRRTLRAAAHAKRDIVGRG